MALINGMYIHVVDEEVNENVEVSSHPVEEGVDITDHVKSIACTASMSGYIVGSDAWPTLAAVRSLCKKGQLIKYEGRNILSNYIITDFSSGHPHEVWGGCSFDMTIQQVRTAKSPYTPGSAATQQVTEAAQSKTETDTTRYHTVKNGDTLWGIAVSYYGNGAQYKKILEANRNIITNENVIVVGWKLVIP